MVDRSYWVLVTRSLRAEDVDKIGMIDIY